MITNDQRIDLVSGLVASMLKGGEIFEDQMLQLRDDLMNAADEDLQEARDSRGSGFLGDSQAVGF